MSTDERNAGRIILKVGGRPIAPALTEHEHDLAMIAAEAMWFPYFGDEGQTFEERAPGLTAHWKDYGRFAVAALRPYLTTTAPSTVAPRLTDGDTMREAVQDAIENAFRHVYFHAGRPVGSFAVATDAAIAAAEPHLRAKHRAELFAELIREYQHNSDIANEHGESARSIGWHRAMCDLQKRQQAEATRPVDERGDR